MIFESTDEARLVGIVVGWYWQISVGRTTFLRIRVSRPARPYSDVSIQPNPGYEHRWRLGRVFVLSTLKGRNSNTPLKGTEVRGLFRGLSRGWDDPMHLVVTEDGIYDTLRAEGLVW